MSATGKTSWDALSLSPSPSTPISSAILRRPRSCTIIALLTISCFLTFILLQYMLGLVSNLHCVSTLDVYNSTLGFQKIFVIGFKERTDKRDALTLASSYTGFDLNWLDAVPFGDVPKKAAPLKWDYEHMTPGALGCWRAHLNAVEKVVAEKIQTALILEDDVDWDVALKSQLEQFANGAQALQGSPNSAFSPYGNDWDLLWLGHCRIGTGNQPQNYYVIENDHTVAPVRHRRAKWKQTHIVPEMLSNSTRMVFNNNGGMCAHGYAITYEGARKLLTSLSIHGEPREVDVGYNRMCYGRFAQPFKCYAPYPPLFATHRFAGPTSRDSDINNNTEEWHNEYTFDIVYSTIQNLDRFANGERFALAQWPQEMEYAEVSVESKVQVHGEIRSITLGEIPETEVKYINAQ